LDEGDADSKFWISDDVDETLYVNLRLTEVSTGRRYVDDATDREPASVGITEEPKLSSLE
jgi:hypothetical protein